LPAPTPSSTPSVSSTWASMYNRLALHHTTNDGQAITEMDNYLADDMPARISDPFDWWRVKTTLYPRLSILVKKYHCLGQIITVRRNRLSVQKAAKTGTIADNVSLLNEKDL